MKREVRRDRLAAIYGVTAARMEEWLAKHSIPSIRP
jgi:hypothetical protein